MNGKSIYYLGMKFFAAVVLITGTVFLFAQSIRLDEAQSIWVASKTVPGIVKFAATDVHVPVYFLLLHFWMIIFGNGLVAARLLSLIFFLLTLPVVYKLGKEEDGEETAVISLILFATAPFIIWYVSEVRMYTFFILATSLSHLMFLRFVRGGGRNMPGLFFANVLGIYSHYFFSFIILTQALYLFLSKERRTRLLMRYFLLNIPVYFAFAPWAYYVLSVGQVVNAQPLLPIPTTYNLFQLFSLIVFGFQTSFVTGIIISLWPLLLVIFFFFFTQSKAKPFNFYYFFLATILPVIINFLLSILVKPIFLPRYLIFITPSLFFIMAYFIKSLNGRIRPVVFSGTAILLASFLFIQAVSENNPDKKDYQQAAIYLSTVPTYADVIAITPPFTLYPIEYFYKGKAGLATIPFWDRYATGPVAPYVKDKLIEQMEDFSKTYVRMYAVFSYDQGYEKEIIDYLDNNYQIDDVVEYPGVTIKAYRLRYDVDTKETANKD